MANSSKNNKYRPEFAQELIKHMSDGSSMESFTAVIWNKYGIYISKTSLYNWKNEKPEFKEAYNIGYALGLKFYEELAKAHATGHISEKIKKVQNMKMDSKIVCFKLQTRFHREYGNQIKIQGAKNGEPIKVQDTSILKEQSDEVLEKILAAMDKNNGPPKD